jgi:PAS domain S-box-containing protein
MNEKMPDEETRPTPPGGEEHEGAKAAEEIEQLRLIIDSIDITKQRQAEEPWHRSEAFLDIALEAGRMGIFEFNVRSGKVTWSPHLERIHGLKPGTFGGTFEDFKRDVHPGDLDRVLNQVQQTIQEKRTDYGVEYRIIKPSGETAWVEGRGRVFYSANGEAERFVGLCIDVTARKRAEEERTLLLAREQQARREAEAANRAKDEFLATVSHELRTPLNAIYGWARLLQMGDLDRETVASAYETIGRNAKAQAQLIDDLLDVSRIIAGKLRLDVRSIELRPVIEAAIETVQPAADAKGITLQSIFDERIGPISGDPDRLQQVVWNLLSNAIKFTPTGGRVEIGVDQIDSAVQIHVRDTGIGIPPEFLPYVFDRFRQAEGASTRLYGGLGLGLAIVRHLVELHGGTVSANSAGEGRGATFTVTLPLKAPPAASLDPEMKHPSEEGVFPLHPALTLNGIEILLVDDEADARQLLTLILQKAGARVITVSSVQEAIDRLKRNKPDLLISDIEMPGEDGYSLIRRVRAQEAERGERSVPTVALTAYAGRADRRRALMAGFQKHIPKPVDPARLVAVVASLVGLPREVHQVPDRSLDKATP